MNMEICERVIVWMRPRVIDSERPSEWEEVNVWLIAVAPFTNIN